MHRLISEIHLRKTKFDYILRKMEAVGWVPWPMTVPIRMEISGSIPLGSIFLFYTRGPVHGIDFWVGYLGLAGSQGLSVG